MAGVTELMFPVLPIFPHAPTAAMPMIASAAKGDPGPRKRIIKISYFVSYDWILGYRKFVKKE
jgi:hypothetical protein